METLIDLELKYEAVNQIMYNKSSTSSSPVFNSVNSIQRRQGNLNNIIWKDMRENDDTLTQ